MKYDFRDGNLSGNALTGFLFFAPKTNFSKSSNVSFYYT